jgi:hypothetical protein
VGTAAEEDGVTVMPANNTGITTGWLAGRWPGRIGHLYSPGGQRGPFHFISYALDNGAYGAHLKKQPFDVAAWRSLLDWAKLSGRAPLWALVPDVVGDRLATLAAWDEYSPVLRSYGWPLAFAVQDGMTYSDVPRDASVVFVGGSTDWKWKTMADWCAAFPRVHVGRVNTYRRLWDCHDAGAESCDGTGWMRGSQLQLRGLLAYLEESSYGEKRRAEQMRIFGEEVSA